MFMAIILLPLFNVVTHTWKFQRRAENRTFKDSVKMDINNLDAFPQEYEKYVNDNFSFRTPLLNLYNNIKFHFYRVSPYPDKTIVGKDGWYFVAGKEKDSYEGKINFSDEQLKQFDVEWTSRKKYLDSMNIKAYWVICPMKYNVYPEMLPFNVYKNGKRRVEKLTAYLQKKFPGIIVDPLPQLLQAKDSLRVYYKLDDHWNERGGYVASQVLLSKIKIDFPKIKINTFSDYVWENRTFHGGFHYGVLGVDSLSENDMFSKAKNQLAIETTKYGFPPIPDFPYPWDYERRYLNTKDTTGLKILIIRDSFGDQVTPFIKESFKESVFIFDKWRYGLNKEIIEKFRPDIVVFLGLETHLSNMIMKY